VSISRPLFLKKADAGDDRLSAGRTVEGRPPTAARNAALAQFEQGDPAILACLAIVEAVRENKEPRRSSMHRRDRRGSMPSRFGTCGKVHYVTD
jgi:hypothetical protein